MPVLQQIICGNTQDKKGAQNKGTDQYVDATKGHVDGIYGTYCETWKKHFKGCPEADLAKLPRVVTENGWYAGGKKVISLQKQLETAKLKVLEAKTQHEVDELLAG